MGYGNPDNLSESVRGSIMIQFSRCVFRPALAVLCLMAALVIGAAFAGAPGPDVVAPGQVLRGHFVQERQLAGFAKPLRSEGSFLLVPGRGLIWRGEKPFATTTIITAGGILQLVNGQQAMHLSATKLPGLAQLYSVLGAAVSGNTAALRQAFTVSESSTADGWRVELKPLNSQAMSQLNGLTLRGGRFVDSVEVERSGGDVDRITFSEHRISKADLTPDEIAQLKAAAK